MIQAREGSITLSEAMVRSPELTLGPAWPPPVSARCGSAAITGYLDCVTEAEAVIQSLDVLPPLDGECEVAIDLPLGEVRARGPVSAVDPEDGSFRVSLDRFESRGYLLLAAALLAGDPGAGPA
jgi:hypothetical protein